MAAGDPPSARDLVVRDPDPIVQAVATDHTALIPIVPMIAGGLTAPATARASDQIAVPEVHAHMTAGHFLGLGVGQGPALTQVGGPPGLAHDHTANGLTAQDHTAADLTAHDHTATDLTAHDHIPGHEVRALTEADRMGPTLAILVVAMTRVL